MKEKIYQLLYLSSASHLMDHAELLSLLENARENNKKLGITGFMLYSDGNIIQLLEGKKEQVESLFEKILMDHRHFGAISLIKGYTESRDFPNWSMGFERVDPTKLESGIEGFNTLLTKSGMPQKEYKEISKRVRIYIDSFRLMARRS